MSDDEQELRDEIARLKQELVELQQVQRLATVGKMAVGLAHEINNPLAVMQGRIELLQQMDLTDVRRSKKQLAVIHEHGFRIARTVSNLQAFAMPGPTNFEAVDLLELVERSTLLAERVLRAVRVEYDEVAAGLAVRGDRTQLEQAFVNLLSNGAEAMRAGGKIRIRATVVDGFVVISIEDEGLGFPEELLADLFAPFRSGRSAARRTGMGLAIAWSILSEHDGAIEVSNIDSGGVRFDVKLPRASAYVEADVKEETPEAFSSKTSLRLLVVEDEQALLDTILDMAESAGYAVEGVTSAEFALERLGEETFDGVVTDIRLPGMNGVELLRVLESAHPRLVGRVVLMSGLFHPAPPGVPYLQKPFTRVQFVSQLDAVLAASQTTAT